MDLVLRQTSSMLIWRITFDITFQLTCFLFLAAETQNVIMSPIQLFSFCVLIGIAGGLANAYRNRNKNEVTSNLVITNVLNMGTFGASLAMLLYAVLHKQENIEWMIIGIVGLVSLGGVGSIDWAVDQVRERVKKVLGGNDE